MTVWKQTREIPYSSTNQRMNLNVIWQLCMLSFLCWTEIPNILRPCSPLCLLPRSYNISCCIVIYRVDFILCYIISIIYINFLVATCKWQFIRLCCGCWIIIYIYQMAFGMYFQQMFSLGHYTMTFRIGFL